MGNYYFTSCADGSKTKVEYTFGYKKNADGKAGMCENGSLSQSRLHRKGHSGILVNPNPNTVPKTPKQ